MYTEQNEKSWEEWHAEHLAIARLRPAMIIGPPDVAHRLCLRQIMRLTWQAKIVRRPQCVKIDLSPTQYVVRSWSGPLIRPVQKALTFPGRRELGDTWNDDMKQYSERLYERDKELSRSYSDFLWNRSWRYCFCGPTGPRLQGSMYDAILARRLAWGVRTDHGMWCQIYEAEWPLGTPFLIEGPSPIGLFQMGELDPEWFTGLPYDKADVAELISASNKPVGLDKPKLHRPQPAWKMGQIEARWHPADTLLPSPITPDAIRGWLL